MDSKPLQQLNLSNRVRVHRSGTPTLLDSVSVVVAVPNSDFHAAISSVCGSTMTQPLFFPNLVSATRACHEGTSILLIFDEQSMTEEDLKALVTIRRGRGESVFVIGVHTLDCDPARNPEVHTALDDTISWPTALDQLGRRIANAGRNLLAAHHNSSLRRELEVAEEKFQLASRTLSVTARRFEALFHGIPVPCFVFDKLGQIEEWNEAAESAFGIPSPRAVHKTVHFLFGQEDDSCWRPAVIRQVFEGVPMLDYEWVFSHSEGGPAPFRTSLVPLIGPNEIVFGGLAVSLQQGIGASQADFQASLFAGFERFALEVSGKKALFMPSSVEEAAIPTEDGLTGLHNYDSFLSLLDDEVLRCDQAGQPLMVIAVDVDGLSAINDEAGYVRGNEVLVRVGEVLSQVLGPRAVISRTRGSQFLSAVPGLSRDEARNVSQEIRSMIESATGIVGPVSISIGISGMEPGVDPQCMLDVALHDLSMAKRAHSPVGETVTEFRSAA